MTFVLLASSSMLPHIVSQQGAVAPCWEPVSGLGLALFSNDVFLWELQVTTHHSVLVWE